MHHSTVGACPGVRPLRRRVDGSHLPGRLAVLAIAALVSACQSLPFPGNPDGDGTAATAAQPSEPISSALTRQLPAEPDARMVTNLVDALVQLHPPRETTVQISAADDSNAGQTVVEALVQRGYGIQRVKADLGANLLDWQRLPEKGVDDESTVQWRIAIGTIGVRRSFQVDSDAPVTPVSPLILSGTRSLVTLDDSMFTGTSAARTPYSTIEFASGDSMLENLPTISLITDDLIQGISQTATTGTATRALNSSKVEVNNLFHSDAIDGYGGVSAFTNIRDDYERIHGETVIFADDSLRLGPQGKRQVEAFLENFQPNQDLIGLIGCSNGPTKLDIGNQGLALGRSQRVAEELLSLGVPRESILDEGCWSETSAGGRFPSRGVVLELLRRPLG